MKGLLCIVFLVSVLVEACIGICQQGVNCKLPNCFCPAKKLSMPRENTPQIIYFGFDDAVNVEVAKHYRRLFSSDRKNPNGCPISMTLYVQHQYTDYSLVNEFYHKGMEIGVHSVTHSNIDTEEKLRREADQQRKNLANLGKVPLEEIVGWRSPNLKTAGDAQPRVLKSLGYEYDISLTYLRGNFGRERQWPYTLDFGYPFSCMVLPCPGARSRHAGFWEVPVNSLVDYKNEYPCPYVDGCFNRPENEDQAFKFLWRNFLDYYENSRTPLGFNMHAAWFFTPHNLKAMDRFIKQVLTLKDVYIVNVKQLLDFMKEPTTLDQIKYISSWNCQPGQLKPIHFPTPPNEKLSTLNDAPTSTTTIIPSTTTKTSTTSLTSTKQKVTFVTPSHTRQIPRRTSTSSSRRPSPTTPTRPVTSLPSGHAPTQSRIPTTRNTPFQRFVSSPALTSTPKKPFETAAKTTSVNVVRTSFKDIPSTAVPTVAAIRSKPTTAAIRHKPTKMNVHPTPTKSTIRYIPTTIPKSTTANTRIRASPTSSSKINKPRTSPAMRPTPSTSFAETSVSTDQSKNGLAPHREAQPTFVRRPTTTFWVQSSSPPSPQPSFPPSQPPILPKYCVQGLNCKSPNCMCRSTGIPRGLNRLDTPQMVYFTFDGPVTFSAYNNLRNLFNPGRRNPNNCTISSTLFVSRSGNFMPYMEELASMGLEVSLRGDDMDAYRRSANLASDLSNEISYMKAKLPVKNLKGWRSPALKPLGDAQFSILKAHELTYDSTISLPAQISRKNIPWPYTLDFKWQDRCDISGCPTEEHPGIWEVPVVPLTDYRNLYPCTYADGCMFNPPTAEDTFNFLWNNFKEHYIGNRSPFGITLRNQWFSHPLYRPNLEGLDRFIRTLQTVPSVYVVSIQNVIDWMKNPTPISELGNFVPWRCQ